jgi:hypothetical protein
MTNCSEPHHECCGERVPDICDLLKDGLHLGFEFLEAIKHCGETVLGDVTRLEKKIGRGLFAGCCCEVPPPCWMPRPLGDLSSHVCRGGTATVRLRITNCGITGTKVAVEAAGKPADTQGVKIEPASLDLESMERGWITVSFTVPAEAGDCSCREILLWVRGCRNHFLRWKVCTAHRGADSCHEVWVEDCPDFIHRWSDHFYCYRSCLPQRIGDRHAA